MDSDDVINSYLHNNVAFVCFHHYIFAEASFFTTPFAFHFAPIFTVSIERKRERESQFFSNYKNTRLNVLYFVVEVCAVPRVIGRIDRENIAAHELIGRFYIVNLWCCTVANSQHNGHCSAYALPNAATWTIAVWCVHIVCSYQHFIQYRAHYNRSKLTLDCFCSERKIISLACRRIAAFSG